MGRTRTLSRAAADGSPDGGYAGIVWSMTISISATVRAPGAVSRCSTGVSPSRARFGEVSQARASFSSPSNARSARRQTRNSRSTRSESQQARQDDAAVGAESATTRRPQPPRQIPRVSGGHGPSPLPPFPSPGRRGQPERSETARSASRRSPRRGRPSSESRTPPHR